MRTKTGSKNECGEMNAIGKILNQFPIKLKIHFSQASSGLVTDLVMDSAEANPF